MREKYVCPFSERGPCHALQVIFDTVRIPKLLLTDEEGKDGVPVWESVNYETDVSNDPCEAPP
jgi:hypothetical protein